MASEPWPILFPWDPRTTPPSQAIRSSPARELRTGSGDASLARDVACDGKRSIDTFVRGLAAGRAGQWGSSAAGQGGDALVGLEIPFAPVMAGGFVLCA